ncbi:winged helix-turn-helix domain-containing protein [Enterococcus sp. BWM-S5]|uniref:Winged helix-turn-helix domain-containing protein n=1 Tax=Enterococcus larvae TaxID=2794352 RepID=A0ABS4CFH7_9ENTE|nr:helix-turn-helix domain-containing protein [Enterococcus larvae]MBP1044677.1 winged helix-turn-helix domain-containing protein [Enterococcus larvae]
MLAGVISLSENFSESFFDKLKEKDIDVVQLTPEDFEEKISKIEVVIIRGNTTKDAAEVCNILIKLKEKSDAHVWTFLSKTPQMMRSVYLQLGALGIVPEDCQEDELQLLISNNLNKINNLSNDFGKNQEGISGEKGKESLERVVLNSRNLSVQILGNEEISLTKIEYKTLYVLYKNLNTTVTYSEISEEIWKKQIRDSKIRIANIIFHLRKKIEASGILPDVIRTVRSKGYMLDLSGDIRKHREV